MRREESSRGDRKLVIHGEMTQKVNILRMIRTRFFYCKRRSYKKRKEGDLNESFNVDCVGCVGVNSWFLILVSR